MEQSSEDLYKGLKPDNPDNSGNANQENTDPAQEQQDSGKDPENHESPQENKPGLGVEVPSPLEVPKVADTFISHRQREDLQLISESIYRVKEEINKVMIGQAEMTNLLLAGIISGGHVLLEGVPGIAKTLAARLLTKTLSTGFSRIQFTPDMMPSDIIGTSVYSMKTGDFNFKSGPVFSNMILIDEINRAPAKTQAALFEVMEERQVTVDGNTYKMEFPFFVIATQNPIEQEGTYKLPEAQLDRFLFRIKLKYPSLDEEIKILQRFSEAFDPMELIDKVLPVFKVSDLKKCQSIIETIHIKDDLLSYIATIVDKTRNHHDIFLGASPRASLAIMKSSKAIAAMNGRFFVTPDDIRYVAGPVMNHRLILTSEKELEGVSVEEVINHIISEIEVPR